MKLKTIVVGLDLSETSELGARWVANQFAPNARLVLVHCRERRRIPAFLDDAGIEGLEEEFRRSARESLNELVRELGPRRAELIVRDGEAAGILAEVATEEGADLLAVGARQRMRMMGTVLGSTASHLLAVSETPVLVTQGPLVVRGPGASRPRRILAAIDASPARERVLDWTAELARMFDASAHVVYAVEPPGVDVGTTLFASGDEYREARARIVKKAEAWLEGVLEEAGHVGERFHAGVAYGSPGLEIASTAHRSRAELVVMGTRGQGIARAFVTGSVAREVIALCDCPVLVIPEAR